jgi:signal transduction histidine kinase
VILNLIINAVEAMGSVLARSRALVISTARHASNILRVAVQDSGPEFKPENADRIFEPFYTTKPSGMGMGLTICRSIIEASGCDLSFHSAGARRKRRLGLGKAGALPVIPRPPGRPARLGVLRTCRQGC